jgi:hypothetical protein
MIESYLFRDRFLFCFFFSLFSLFSTIDILHVSGQGGDVVWLLFVPFACI